MKKMSRGQRQRLKRRHNAETGDKPTELKEKKNSESKPKTEEPQIDAKTRVADLLRKREKKLEAKQ